MYCFCSYNTTYITLHTLESTKRLIKSNTIVGLSSTELIVVPSIKQSYSVVTNLLDSVSSVGQHKDCWISAVPKINNSTY